MEGQNKRNVNKNMKLNLYISKEEISEINTQSIHGLKTIKRSTP